MQSSLCYLFTWTLNYGFPDFATISTQRQILDFGSNQVFQPPGAIIFIVS